MLAHFVALYFIFKVSGDNGNAGTGVAGNFIKVGEGLHLLFDFVSQVHLYLFGAGSGPRCRNYHLLNGEARVFTATKVAEGEDTHYKDENCKEIDKLFMFNGPFSPVAIPHLESPLSIRRTDWSGTSLLMPAVTTTSPAFSPLATITLLSL